MNFKKTITVGLFVATSTCFAGTSIAEVENMSQSTFNPLFGETYQMDTLKSKGIFDANKNEPTIIITELNGNFKVSGHSGCNRFSAHLVKVNDKMKTTNAISTQKMCHGNAMIVENEFMNTLRTDSTWMATDTGLSIVNSKTELVFKLK